MSVLSRRLLDGTHSEAYNPTVDDVASHDPQRSQSSTTQRAGRRRPTSSTGLARRIAAVKPWADEWKRLKQSGRWN